MCVRSAHKRMGQLQTFCVVFNVLWFVLNVILPYVIEQLREPYRIDSIARRTDIQTGQQQRPGYYLLRQHDRRAPPPALLGVHDVTDRNLRDTDLSTVTGRELM